MVPKQKGAKTPSQELGQDLSPSLGPGTSLGHWLSPGATLGWENVGKGVRRALGLGVQDMTSCPGIQASVSREPPLGPASDASLLSVVTDTKQGLGS